jgi:hypothetical protein
MVDMGIRDEVVLRMVYRLTHGTVSNAADAEAAAMLCALLAERNRLREALTKIATSSKQLPGQMFVAFAREVVTREALKETGHD